MNTTNRISDGALRAGREIARRFRRHMPRLPVSSDLTLAAIIEAETNAQAMLEALEKIAARFDPIPCAEAAIRKAKGET